MSHHHEFAVRPQTVNQLGQGSFITEPSAAFCPKGRAKPLPFPSDYSHPEQTHGPSIFPPELADLVFSCRRRITGDIASPALMTSTSGRAPASGSHDAVTRGRAPRANR